MAATWPLIGRELELDRAGTLLRERDARGIVLAGPAGVGKTRLGDACVELLDRPHVAVRGTRSAAGIPFGAFAAYLPPSGLESDADYVSLRRASDALLAQTASEPSLLYVDDAHALDDASAALVMHIARARRMLLLVTMRTGEDAPQALRDLWKDELQRIDLTPLDFDAVDALLRAMLGGEVESATVHSLHDASQGNPLYLRELVGGLVDAGTVIEDGGLWRLRGEMRAPPRLTELVAERLEGLGPRERFVLDVLALTEPLGLGRLDELGWSSEWTALERRGLVLVHKSRRRRFARVAHPLYGEVARAEVSTRRRDAILQAAADYLTKVAVRRRDDPRRVAVWQLELGQQPDPDVVLAAARDARLAGDHDGAARFARSAVEGGAGVAASVLLGTSLDAIGRNDEAERVLLAAESLAADDSYRTLVALARSDNLFRGLARADDAHRVVDAALEPVTDPLRREELVAQQAMFALFEARVHDTRELADPLLARPDDVAFCRGALQAAMIRVVSGELEQARDIATRAFEARVVLGDELHLPNPGVYLVALGLAQEQLGAIDLAIGTAQASYDAAAADDARNGMAWLALALARAHLLAGRVRTAARFAREAAVVFGELDHPNTRWGLGLVALTAAQMGDAVAAEEAMADLDAEPSTPVVMMDTEVERARAWVHAARGDLLRARVTLLAAADAANVKGLHTLESAALHDVARLGGAADAAPRLEAIAKAVDGVLMDARVAFARACEQQDAPTLEATAEAFETMGAMLDAAETWNEAAIAHRRHGAARAAAAAAQRARVATEQCEGARTPSLAQGTDAAVLTKREREIATLAANGLSNREIAEALVVSSRTVENHLQRAFEKLGVSSRAELPDAMARANY